MLFRSDDGAMSFAPVETEHAWGRGMVMRLRRDPSGGAFFGVTNDGNVIRADGRGSVAMSIAEKLPPAYDLAVLP
jgi:hypothetical protein